MVLYTAWDCDETLISRKKTYSNYMVAKSKPRATRKDKSQDKRIARLERNFPMVKEVINNASSLLYNDTTQGHVYSLLPSTLDTEKVMMRGYSYRTISSTDVQSLTSVRFRAILLIYKCTADYSSAGSPTYVPPVINDILNDNGDKTLANYNPDNASRIRVLFDRTYIPKNTSIHLLERVSKMYKKNIQFMPLTDKAFVNRPFLVVVSGDTTATQKLSVAHDLDIHTLQTQ